MIVIVDYGVGNLGSILNMLKKVNASAIISSSIKDIEEADKLILPGVGAFDSGMEKLMEGNFIDALNKKVLEQKTPILGICLGFQLMTRKSEEGKLNGLGWIEADTVKFKFTEEGRKYKVPFMGWNQVKICKESPLMKDMYENPRFYLVHSYYVKPDNEKDILTTTQYSLEYASAIEKNNIFGVQFHPEKSHKYGMKLFKNFIEIT